MPHKDLYFRGILGKSIGDSKIFEFLKENILDQIDVENDKINFVVSFTKKLN